MININNKQWDKLRCSDVQKVLSGTDDESFFFEFKSDDEPPRKLIKEISALANTYGGYIFLGVNDDKSIGGCNKWTEQRIHATIHDSITPTPIFDVKKFKPGGKRIFVIKIEEGNLPPYITNEGHIYERVSSGSFPIKDSSKLSQLYYKREEQLRRIKNKIELDEVSLSTVDEPNNICGYLDMGFSLNLSETTKLQKQFRTYNFEDIAKCIRTLANDFSISILGNSILISIGSVTVTGDGNEKKYVKAGINNFMEVLCDGSIKCRILLTIDPTDMSADITSLLFLMYNYKEIYSSIFGEELLQKFISAQKYEKLTVLKQFTPIYRLSQNSSYDDIRAFHNYLATHKKKYGNNLMIESSRVPKNDYLYVDKRYVLEVCQNYNAASIIDVLFSSWHSNLGYIDPIQDPQSNN